MRQRGFTLIELVTSLFVSSVVVVALASCIALVSRAVPDASRPEERLRTLQSIAARIADDARFATDVTIVNGRQIELVVGDRDGDDQPESILYSWSGTAGDSLNRQQNGDAAVALYTSIDQAAFAWSTDPVLATSSAGTLQITLEAGTTRVVTASRTMNLPSVAAGGSDRSDESSPSSSGVSTASSSTNSGGRQSWFGRDDV